MVSYAHTYAYDISFHNMWLLLPPLQYLKLGVERELAESAVAAAQR